MAEPLLIAADRETLDIAIEALRSQVSRLQRAATKAAGELDAEAAADPKLDRRRSAVKITKVLSDAARLETFAELLEDALAHPERPRSPEAEVMAAAREEIEETRRSAETVTDVTVEDPDNPDDPGEDVEDAIGASETEED